ncbi:MAG: transposase [Sphaerochaeta associata]|uniref:transposase n=1 Tax=Sphaerochaeta associata TaxID=1129264 RepID=UPI002B20D0E0|nr:transposase [Sphaerochaeta associata]MEA5106066.1 transposase [Sphaerochaeta associata]
MAIPEAVRKVERPRNTIVVRRGNGPLMYAVVERIGCRRIGDSNVPLNGYTVGHIIQGAFVPSSDAVSQRKTELKDYADAVLIDLVSRELLEDLYAVYSVPDAMRIYAIALLRVCYPGVPCCRLDHYYETSWVSILFPGIPLGRNSVSTFLQNLGKSYSLIVSFMRRRVDAIAPGHHIAIDGTLKEDNSSVNSLSGFSRKARVKGTMDITVVFAYDIDLREPVCSKVFGGNVLDYVSYQRFLTENGLTKGVVMADKGFPKKEAQQAFASSPGLHWLSPIKRNAKRIAAHGMYAFDGMLDDRNEDVLFKKEQVADYWLYSYYDRKRAAKEEADYFKHHKGKPFDAQDMQHSDERFGTIVFESDLDTDPLVIYKMYDERWLIEECFRYYKHVTDFDDTRVHSDVSVYGSEFINFISSVMTARLIRKFDETGLFSDMTYNDIMSRLASAKKVNTNGDGQWEYVRTTRATEETLLRLGLLPKMEEPAKKKRGRPKKVVDPNAPKRKRGRPRKNPS